MENPDEINVAIPSLLYISAIHCRFDYELLNGSGITVVCDVSNGEAPQFDGIKYHIYRDILDSEQQSLLAVMESVFSVLQDEMSKGGKVLVHCQQGVSRSAAIVLYCMLRLAGGTKSLKDCFKELKQSRRIILPNSNFLRELTIYEVKLLGTTSLELGKYGQLLWK